MTGLYQPKIKDPLIRKLYFAAKREGKKMTHLINEILEESLGTEPEPPPYETSQHRGEANPKTLERKLQAYAKLFRAYYGELHGTQAYESAADTRGEAEGQALAESAPDRQDSV
jgi:hypothetical protein